MRVMIEARKGEEWEKKEKGEEEEMKRERKEG